jgi:hypothetical protein
VFPGYISVVQSGNLVEDRKRLLVDHGSDVDVRFEARDENVEIDRGTGREFSHLAEVTLDGRRRGRSVVLQPFDERVLELPFR